MMYARQLLFAIASLFFLLLGHVNSAAVKLPDNCEQIMLWNHESKNYVTTTGTDGERITLSDSTVN